jgi:hypothetical protein
MVCLHFLLASSDEGRVDFLRSRADASVGDTEALAEEPDLGQAVFAHDLEQLEAPLPELELVAIVRHAGLDAREHLFGPTVVAIGRDQQTTQSMMRSSEGSR